MHGLPSIPVRAPSPPTQLPFRIRTLGRVRGQPYHATAGTYHDDVMLTLVRDGTGFYYTSDRIERVGRGHIGIVLPSAEPGVLIADRRDPYDHYYCRFAGQEAQRMARAVVAEQGGQAFFHFARWPEASAIIEAMLALHVEPLTTESEWMTQTEGELARLLALLMTSSTPGESRLSETNLRRYMIDRMIEPFDLDKMAQHFGMSRSHLSRRASEILGEPLGSASRRLKLEFSRSLLDATSLDLTVADIACRVGYHDAFYFSKVFRRQFGISPTTYRNHKNGVKRQELEG